MEIDFSKNNSLPSLFNADVVWDSSRSSAVQKMNEQECHTMAKWTAWALRLGTPKFSEAFRELEETRRTLANTIARLRHLSAQQIDQQSAVEVKEYTERTKRRRDHNEKKLNNLYGLISDYRRASGYRIFSLLALGERWGFDKKTTDAAHAMQKLGTAQDTHLEMQFTVEKLRAFQKLDVGASDEVVRTEITTMHSLLECHVSRAMQVADSLQIEINGQTLDQIKMEFEAKTPAISDPILTTLSQADCAIELFRSSNRYLTQSLAGAIDLIAEKHFPMCQVFPEAA